MTSTVEASNCGMMATDWKRLMAKKYRGFPGATAPSARWEYRSTLMVGHSSRGMSHLLEFVLEFMIACTYGSACANNPSSPVFSGHPFTGPCAEDAASVGMKSSAAVAGVASEKDVSVFVASDADSTTVWVEDIASEVAVANSGVCVARGDSNVVAGADGDATCKDVVSLNAESASGTVKDKNSSFASSCCGILLSKLEKYCCS